LISLCGADGEPAGANLSIGRLAGAVGKSANLEIGVPRKSKVKTAPLGMAQDAAPGAGRYRTACAELRHA
jgi:hypothetical protein